MRGKKPQPLALKLLRGETHKDRLNMDQPQPPVAETIAAPPGLSPAAAALWHYYAPLLQECRVLTLADNETLRAFCHDTALAQEAEATLARDGLIVRTQTGAQQHPALLALNKLRASSLKLAVELGLTPSSRNRIRALPPDRVGIRVRDREGKGRFFSA